MRMKPSGTTLKKVAPWIAGVVGGVFLVANFAGALYVERMMAPPRRKKNKTSDLDDFVPEVKYDTAECCFQTEDGVRLSSLVLTPEVSNGSIVLVCHGLAHDKNSGVRFVQYLLKEGYTLLAIDFRNHGDSQGE